MQRTEVSCFYKKTSKKDYQGSYCILFLGQEVRTIGWSNVDAVFFADLWDRTGTLIER
jgi:hypothetical protein